MTRRRTQDPRHLPPLLPPSLPPPVQEPGSGHETLTGASPEAAGVVMAGLLRALPPAIQRWSALVAGLLSAGDAWARRVVGALRHLLVPRLDQKAAGAEDRTPKASAGKSKPNARRRRRIREAQAAEVRDLASSPSSPRGALTGPAASFLGAGPLVAADAAQGAPPTERASTTGPPAERPFNDDALQPQDGGEGASSPTGVQVSHSMGAGPLVAADASQGAPPAERASTTGPPAERTFNDDALQPQDGGEGASSPTGVQVSHSMGVQVGDLTTPTSNDPAAGHRSRRPSDDADAPSVQVRHGLDGKEVPYTADAIQSLAPQDCGEASLLGDMPARLATHPVPGAKKEAVAKKPAFAKKKAVAKKPASAKKPDGMGKGAHDQDERCFADDQDDKEIEAHKSYFKKALACKNFIYCLICHLENKESKIIKDKKSVETHLDSNHKGGVFFCKWGGCLVMAKTKHDLGLHEKVCHKY